jgi:hypothetical protein
MSEPRFIHLTPHALGGAVETEGHLTTKNEAEVLFNGKGLVSLEPIFGAHSLLAVFRTQVGTMHSSKSEFQ